MPFSVLGDQVPHSLLFPNQPFFCLPLRVFGCTCFVHILTPGQYKLSTKAMKCIFLGYSCLQCGYRCYSLDTHRYFFFVDVTFFKHSSIFSSPLPSSLEVLSLPLIFPLPTLSSKSPATSPRLLQVYTRRPHTDTRPLDDSSPMVPPPRHRSCRQPLILLSPFGKVLVPLVILILFILSCLIIVYPHHILLLFPTCILFLFLTLYTRPLLIRVGNRQWLKKWLLCTFYWHMGPSPLTC